jgi:hypothetical protein
MNGWLVAKSRLFWQRRAASAGPKSRRGRGRRRPRLEWLEDRTLPSGSTLALVGPLAGDSLVGAIPMAFNAHGGAQASGFLATGRDVEIYAVALAEGDRVSAAVDAQNIGSSLDPALRVFSGTGAQVASNDNYDGRDPRLTFQAPAAGTYYVGVSGSGNTAYDPLHVESGQGGSTGLFTLKLSRTNAPLQPDLVGASFRVEGGPTIIGGTVTVNYSIENRGGAAAGPFDVEVRASGDNRIDDDPSDPLVTTLHVAGLAPGAASTGSLSVRIVGIPGQASPSFTEFLGLRTDPASAATEADEGSYRGSPEHGNDWEAVHVLAAQTAQEPNDSVVTANPLGLNTRVTGTLQPGDSADFYRIGLSESGRLIARVHATGIDTRLSLLDARGIPLVQSDGQSLSNPDDFIDQHLAPGGYLIKVEGLGLATGTYALATEFQPASSPLQPIPTNSQLATLVQGDFNGDGILDLATANVSSGSISVLLGLGDGTFASARSFSLGADFIPFSPVAGDFNGDGILDLAAVSSGSGDVAVLLGRGDGTFASAHSFAAGAQGLSNKGLVAGDFNGDGILDLAVAQGLYQSISVLLGRGDGTFASAHSFKVGAANSFPSALVAGDFNGDGIEDLAAANLVTDDVSVLLGQGDGTFARGSTVAMIGRDFYPDSLAASDVNGDGRLDLVAKSAQGGDSVLLGRGDGTFASAGSLMGQGGLNLLVVGDFNGDGRMDLAEANQDSGTVSVLLGRGDGTFISAGLSPKTPLSVNLVVGDFNGDGILDLAAGNGFSGAVTVLVGRGDGTFADAGSSPAGSDTRALVTGDFNGDGILDLAAANTGSGDVSVFLGQGDGSFASSGSFPVGIAPFSLVAGDFNGDGRLDLAAANIASDNVSVLLGRGDGTFTSAGTFAVGPGPDSVVAGDFNGDGILDLAVLSQDVFVLLGRGDGTFTSAGSFATAVETGDLVAGDFNGDGRQDLAPATDGLGNAFALLGQGDGTFASAGAVAAMPGWGPRLVVGDFNRDGRLDLAVAVFSGVLILLGHGDGTFSAGPVAPGTFPDALVVGDFNNDGILDLATVTVSTVTGAGAVSILQGRGDGTFASARSFPASADQSVLVAGDFNGDGRLDLATIQDTNRLSILLNQKDGTFRQATSVPSNPIRSTPILGDLNGDGIPDTIILDRKGNILYRQGRPGAPGTFAPPRLVNADVKDPRAHAVTLVRGPTGAPFLAAINQSGDALSFYTLGPAGTFVRTAGPSLDGLSPADIQSGDLNGDGFDDLVVSNSVSGDVSIFLADARGSFRALPRIPVGSGPVDITLADLTGTGRLDIAVNSPLAGEIGILRNLGGGAFAPFQRYRGGPGPSDTERLSGALQIRSKEATAGLAVGDFNGDGIPDLVTADTGSNSLALLSGTGRGGFVGPQFFPLAGRATIVCVGDFQRQGRADLAVLDQDSATISIFVPDGQGGLTLKTTVAAGNAPTGLSVADVNGDGNLDLLVGNKFGDVLVLLGNGDGTFRPFQQVDRTGTIALAVADLNGDGIPDVVYSNKGLDRVDVQYSTPGQSFTQGRGDGLLAPGAVTTADLNGDGIPDLVVLNSGGNSVLVYLGLHGGSFAAARQFFVGTNPVGLTIQDLNGDGVPDLVVADQGSNDVTILLGQGRGAFWTLTPGPRLNAGGIGPVATAVADLNGDGIPDLLVSNSGSGTVTELMGRGGGFFNDTAPAVLNVGPNPGQVFAGNFNGAAGPEVVTVPAGTSAVAGDFNGDGFLDLVEADNADGVVSLLLGGPNGLTLAASAELGADARPTALAVASDSNGKLQLFVAHEGEESVLSIGFSLEFGAANHLRGDDQRGQFTDILPLEGGTFGVVVTLLTGAPGVGLAEADLRLDDRAAIAGPPRITGGPSRDPSGPAPPEQTAVDALVSGQDEELQRLRQLIRPPAVDQPREPAPPEEDQAEGGDQVSEDDANGPFGAASGGWADVKRLEAPEMAWGLPAGDEPGLAVALARGADDQAVVPVTTSASLQGRCSPIGPESGSGDSVAEKAASDRVWETVGACTSSAREDGWAALDSDRVGQDRAYPGWLGALALLGSMAWPEVGGRVADSRRCRTARESRPT